MTNLWRSTMSILMAAPLLVACDDKRTANAAISSRRCSAIMTAIRNASRCRSTYPRAPLDADGSRREEADALVRAGLLSVVSPKGVSPSSVEARSSVHMP